MWLPSSLWICRSPAPCSRPAVHEEPDSWCFTVDEDPAFIKSKQIILPARTGCWQKRLLCIHPNYANTTVSQYQRFHIKYYCQTVIIAATWNDNLISYQLNNYCTSLSFQLSLKATLAAQHCLKLKHRLACINTNAPLLVHRPLKAVLTVVSCHTHAGAINWAATVLSEPAVLLLTTLPSWRVVDSRIHSRRPRRKFPPRRVTKEATSLPGRGLSRVSPLALVPTRKQT